MAKILYLINLAFFFLLLSSLPAFAGDNPFTYPSNWGGTGIMEIPTARVMNTDSWRFGTSQVYPFRTYYFAMSPLKELEIDGRMTQILGTTVSSNSPYWSSYGNYKDKAFDFKYQIFPEGKYMPAIAIGNMDPQGTRLFASQYLVASKQVYPFDFTIGLGDGYFGKKPLPDSGNSFRMGMLTNPKKWLKDSQLFGGFQFALSKNYVFMFEYNPVRYQIQKKPWGQQYFNGPAPSKFDFGLRYIPSKWVEIDLSYQRGQELGVNISMPFDIGKPMIPIYDKPYHEQPYYKQMPLKPRIVEALHSVGFSDIGLKQKGSTLIIDLQNDKYFYPTRALGVILMTIAPIVSKDVDDILIIFKKNGIPMFSFSTKREDLIGFYKGKLTESEFLYLSKFHTSYINVPNDTKYFRKDITFGYKPSVQFFLNDPSGFLKGRAGLSVWGAYHLWSGASLVASVGLYPYSDISTINQPLSIPVRSDIANYIKKKLELERLLFQDIYRIPKTNIFTRFDFGILEVEYSGIDAEVAYPLFDGRLMLGISGSVVKKRDPDNPFLLKRNNVKSVYTTGFVNARMYFAKPDIAFDVKFGRFLAGDVGFLFTLSKFINGVKLSAWYSKTDTSIFTDSYNRGYSNTGVSISIPIRLFEGTDSKQVYTMSVSPWTRDVAQDIDHYITLFDYMEKDTKYFLETHRNKMLNPD